MVWLNIYIFNHMVWLKDQDGTVYFVHINLFIDARNMFRCSCAGITEVHKDHFLSQAGLEFWQASFWKHGSNTYRFCLHPGCPQVKWSQVGFSSVEYPEGHRTAFRCGIASPLSEVTHCHLLSPGSAGQRGWQQKQMSGWNWTELSPSPSWLSSRSSHILGIYIQKHTRDLQTHNIFWGFEKIFFPSQLVVSNVAIFYGKAFDCRRSCFWKLFTGNRAEQTKQ